MKLMNRSIKCMCTLNIVSTHLSLEPDTYFCLLVTLLVQLIYRPFCVQKITIKTYQNYYGLKYFKWGGLCDYGVVSGIRTTMVIFLPDPFDFGFSVMIRDNETVESLLNIVKMQYDLEEQTPIFLFYQFPD